jgi:hypothetical protein
MPAQLLIFGMPRSGTTWIGKIFDSHPATLYLHEPDSVQPDNDLPLLLSSPTSGLQSRLDAWLALRDEKVVGSRPYFDKAYRTPTQRRLFELSAFAAKAAKSLHRGFSLTPILLGSSPSLTVWKSIESVGRLPAILELLPDAAALHIIRHPCGQIASTLRGSASGQFDDSGAIWNDRNLCEKLVDQSGTSRWDVQDILSMSPEERLTARWGLINDHALSHLQGDDRYQAVSYEALCQSPHHVTRQLFQQAGLELTHQTDDFLKRSTDGTNENYYATRKDPLVAANRWQHDLDSQTIDRIIAVARGFDCWQVVGAAERLPIIEE